MTIKLELRPETEAQLAATARAQGLSVESAAEKLLKDALANPTTAGRLTKQEFHAMLSAIAEGAERLPDLPTETFSRESFYRDGVNGGNVVPNR